MICSRGMFQVELRIWRKAAGGATICMISSTSYEPSLLMKSWRLSLGGGAASMAASCALTFSHSSVVFHSGHSGRSPSSRSSTSPKYASTASASSLVSLRASSSSSSSPPSPPPPSFLAGSWKSRRPKALKSLTTGLFLMRCKRSRRSAAALRLAASDIRKTPRVDLYNCCFCLTNLAMTA